MMPHESEEMEYDIKFLAVFLLVFVIPNFHVECAKMKAKWKSNDVFNFINTFVN